MGTCGANITSNIGNVNCYSDIVRDIKSLYLISKKEHDEGIHKHLYEIMCEQTLNGEVYYSIILK